MVREGSRFFLRELSPMLKSTGVVVKNGKWTFSELIIAYLIRDDVKPLLYVIGPVIDVCQSLEGATFGVKSARWRAKIGKVKSRGRLGGEPCRLDGEAFLGRFVAWRVQGLVQYVLDVGGQLLLHTRLGRSGLPQCST